MTVMPWPTELRFRKGAQQLHISFEDEAEFTIPYQRLREESPSAEVQGHGAGPKPPQPPVPSDIFVTRAEPVGLCCAHIFQRWPFERSLYLEIFEAARRNGLRWTREGGDT